MSTKKLPEELQGIFFEFDWETSKTWTLPTEVTLMTFQELAWHLDLPVWTTVRGEMRFDLAPLKVLRDPSLFPYRWERIMAVDLRYPLEMFQNAGRWVILDGYHRLARHRVAGSCEVPVRRHPDHYIDHILCASPTIIQEAKRDTEVIEAETAVN